MTQRRITEQRAVVSLNARTRGSERAIGWLTVLSSLPVGLFGLWGFVGLVAGTAQGDAAAVVLGAVFAGLALAVIVGAVLWARRCRTWLEETTLVMTGLFGTKRCDLATAEIGVDSLVGTASSPDPKVISLRPTRRRPVLRLTDVATGHRIELMLQTRSRRPLPPSQVRALAAAIESGTRPQPYDQYARQLAEDLRYLTTK
jgi:hypothetical protein